MMEEKSPNIPKYFPVYFRIFFAALPNNPGPRTGGTYDGGKAGADPVCQETSDCEQLSIYFRTDIVYYNTLLV